MPLHQQSVLITGAAQGIGWHMACDLASRGADVAIGDIRDCRDRLQHDKLPAGSGRLSWLPLDVRDRQQAAIAVAEVCRRHGRLTALVNNASVFSDLQRQSFEQLTDEQWRRSWEVNVLGAFHCVCAAAPAIRQTGGGSIVNIVSDAVYKGLPLLLDYVAAKGALDAMTRSLARELGGDNIRVNAVAPGLTQHEDFSQWDPGRNQQVLARRCLQRTQTPADVAGAVAFLLSPDSQFLSGQTLIVDGGEVM